MLCSCVNIEKYENQGKLAPQPTGRPSKQSLQQAQRQLNDRQLAYATWLATPEFLRNPSSETDLAAHLGVNRSTLWRWRKDPQVQLAVRWMVLHHAGSAENISGVLEYVRTVVHDASESTKSRMAAAKTWLDAVGIQHTFKEDSKLLAIQQVDEIDLDELSDDELWEIYQERARALEAGDLPADVGE